MSDADHVDILEMVVEDLSTLEVEARAERLLSNKRCLREDGRLAANLVCREHDFVGVHTLER